MTGLRVDFPAIGTTVTVVVERSSDLVPARRATEEVIDEFDRACSRFRDDSEIRALQGAGGPVPVSDTLWAALCAADRAFEVTGGLVDPTVGNALFALGYDRDFADLGEATASRQRRVPGRALGRARGPAPVPGWHAVRRDPEARTIEVPAGTLLDLGSTAKALLVDIAADRALERCGGPLLVSVGGDLAVAGPPPTGGWPVRVSSSHLAGPDEPGEMIAVHDGGVASSSTTVRRWHAGVHDTEMTRHHIVDPRSGLPAAEVWTTVTVAGRSCLDANIASTAAILMGEGAPPWLEALGVPARLESSDGTVIRLCGWPDERCAA